MGIYFDSCVFAHVCVVEENEDIRFFLDAS